MYYGKEKEREKLISLQGQEVETECNLSHRKDGILDSVECSLLR